MRPAIVEGQPSETPGPSENRMEHIRYFKVFVEQIKANGIILKMNKIRVLTWNQFECASIYATLYFMHISIRILNVLL